MGRRHKKQSGLICLHYIPWGEMTERKIYIDANKIPSKNHHDPPSSRGGHATIIYIHPITHWAWHVLMGNDFVEEVFAKIIHVWQDECGQIKESYLLGRIKKDEYGTNYDERLLAWYSIFGETRDVSEVMGIIKNIFAKRT